MIKNLHTIQNKGVSLIEVLVAVGVFAIATTAIVFLFIDGVRVSGRSVQTTQATMLASEGVNVAQAISEKDFDLLVSGVHGIEIAGGVWTLTGLEDVQDEFTRSITVSDIGTGIKKVVSEVVWGEAPARTGNVSVTGIFYDWKQTSGDAKNLSVDTQSVFLTSSSTRVEGIVINNTGEDVLTIETLQAQWSGDPLLYEVTIGTTTVFSVTELEGVSSGGVIDIADYSIETSLGTTSLESFVFTDAVTGLDMIISFNLSDGSVKHSFVEF